MYVFLRDTSVTEQGHHPYIIHTSSIDHAHNGYGTHATEQPRTFANFVPSAAVPVHQRAVWTWMDMLISMLIWIDM